MTDQKAQDGIDEHPESNETPACYRHIGASHSLDIRGAYDPFMHK